MRTLPLNMRYRLIHVLAAILVNDSVNIIGPGLAPFITFALIVRKKYLPCSRRSNRGPPVMQSVNWLCSSLFSTRLWGLGLSIGENGTHFETSAFAVAYFLSLNLTFILAASIRGLGADWPSSLPIRRPRDRTQIWPLLDKIGWSPSLRRAIAICWARLPFLAACLIRINKDRNTWYRSNEFYFMLHDATTINWEH